VAVKSSGDISAEPVRGQITDVGIGLDVPNDENRPSLNSGVVAEERQEALLRSESPSGMCAKLHTVAASNNRDHTP